MHADATNHTSTESTDQEWRSLVGPHWRHPSGPRHAITDVPGIRVGHATLSDPERGLCTGVTVVDPFSRQGNLSRQGNQRAGVLPAAVHVINGYGKSAGLMQVAELGELESEIVLTGVYGVGRVLDALVARHLRGDPGLGDSANSRSFNGVVLECNDTHLNDPRVGVAGAAELERAVTDVGPDFDLGPVGAGSGMRTFGWSGGIGSASRLLPVTTDGSRPTIGVLTLSNYGKPADLLLANRPVPPEQRPNDGREGDGSVIIVVATDLAVDPDQLGRIARRVQNGLARTGCRTADGSGELVLAVSTAEVPGRLDRSALGPAFGAVAECVEESVWSALWHSAPTAGRAGRRQPAFPRDLLAHLTPGVPTRADDSSRH